MAQFEWKTMRNVMGDVVFFQVWRQTRELEPGEPMNSGVREHRGSFTTLEDAQIYAAELNKHAVA